MYTYLRTRKCLDCKIDFEAITTQKRCRICQEKIKKTLNDFKKISPKELKKIKIFKNKNKKCYICSSVGGEGGLIVHHINCNRNDNIDRNLLSLCRRCHTRLHAVYHRLGIYSYTMRKPMVVRRQKKFGRLNQINKLQK